MDERRASPREHAQGTPPAGGGDPPKTEGDHRPQTGGDDPPAPGGGDPPQTGRDDPAPEARGSEIDLTAVARGSSRAGAGPAPGSRLLHVAALLRWGALTASVPYALAWTRGTTAGVRLSVVLAHAAGILAIGAWLDASATERGQPLRLRLTRQGGQDAEGLRTAALIAASIAAGAAAWLLQVDVILGLVVLLGLGAGWLAARLPSSRRWFVLPEVAAAVGGLLLPALLVDWRTAASTPLLDTAAGACLVAALVLAVHLRDRADDLAARVPTAATRDAARTRGWLLTLVLVGALLGAAPLTFPLAPLEVVRVLTLGVVGLSATVRRARVPVLYVAHAVFAVTVLLR